MLCDIDVSVIIPVYNASLLIDRCLDSVFAKEGNYRIEVILVDDGSTDDSVLRIKARKEQDRIRLFQQNNSGPSKARNKGILEARGKYIAFLDADDYWYPCFLERTVSFLESHAECVAVSVAQKHLTISGEYEKPNGWKKLSPEEGMIIDDFYTFWGKHSHICTGSILIRREIAVATGGMREDLRVCEDLEYWALLATYGKMGYIPEILFVSDGMKVSEKIGWVQKHLPRWNAAVPLSGWKKRILIKLSESEKDSFNRATGKIGRNLAYNILLSKRYDLARKEIIENGNRYPNDNMSKLLKLGARNSLLWFFVSRLLVKREYNRK